MARHGVTPDEVEEAFRGRNVVVPGTPGTGDEARWLLYGRTAEGRYLTVVFTIREDRIRPVTAHTMHRSDRRIYATEIGPQTGTGAAEISE